MSPATAKGRPGGRRISIMAAKGLASIVRLR